MSILDPILVAFIAGMAVRDLWPLWVRRAARSKRVGASTRVAGSGGRRPPMRRRASRVKIDDDLLLRWLRERNRVLKLSARDEAGHEKLGRMLLTDPVACIVWLGDIVQPQVPFLTAICPSCDGSGRRADTSSGLRDVTKTKPSHYRPAAAAAAGPKGPVTSEGLHLASEANASAIFPADAKTRLLVEIMSHEATHGRCTRTFIKKIRKQTRPAP